MSSLIWQLAAWLRDLLVKKLVADELAVRMTGLPVLLLKLLVRAMPAEEREAITQDYVEVLDERAEDKARSRFPTTVLLDQCVHAVSVVRDHRWSQSLSREIRFLRWVCAGSLGFCSLVWTVLIGVAIAGGITPTIVDLLWMAGVVLLPAGIAWLLLRTRSRTAGFIAWTALGSWVASHALGCCLVSTEMRFATLAGLAMAALAPLIRLLLKPARKGAASIAVALSPFLMAGMYMDAVNREGDAARLLLPLVMWIAVGVVPLVRGVRALREPIQTY